ncbi:MAG: DUF3137 domain-containing protein [Candidatus Thermoplasmatota archaeon]|nr:DUF3137 domain-containing protein [Candidatus Thermoplasmatota archaeon]
MRIFGSSIKEVWRELSEEINANFIEGSFFKGSRVEYKHNNWTIYLDTYTVSTGKSSTTYTRMRLPFINQKKFLFKIYKKGVFSDIGKALGMQDIEIGYDYFDNDYIIKGNDEILLRRLFQNHNIRNLIEKQSRILLEIKYNEGRFGPNFNDDESELYFVVTGVIKNKERLKDLFELFVKMIDEFETLGITVNQTPEVKLYSS